MSHESVKEEKKKSADRQREIAVCQASGRRMRIRIAGGGRVTAGPGRKMNYAAGGCMRHATTNGGDGHRRSEKACETKRRERERERDDRFPSAAAVSIDVK